MPCPLLSGARAQVANTWRMASPARSASSGGHAAAGLSFSRFRHGVAAVGSATLEWA